MAWIGVPALIGRNGVERIFELELNDEERAMMDHSAAAVDAGTATVRDGLAELGRRGLPGSDIEASIGLVRSVAREAQN